MTEPRRYFKELGMRQLRALLELSRRRSFSAAAEALGLSVPSVWQQVRSLEAEFKTPLVEVSGRTVSLTERGRRLVDLAAPVVEGFDAIRDSFAEGAGDSPRRIVVASTASLLVHELRRPLAAYVERFPDVRISFIDRPSSVARKHLEDGEADLAVVGLLEPTAGARLEATPVTAYPFVLVCPARHPLARAGRLSLETLAEQPMVMPGEGTNSRVRVESVFAGAGLAGRLNVVLGASAFDVLAGYVRGGFGVSITSVSPMILAAAGRPRSPYAGLVFRDATDLFGEERVVILRRRNRLEPPHHRAFRELVAELAK